MLAPVFAPKGERTFACIGFAASLLVVLWSARALILGRDSLAAAVGGLGGFASGLALFSLALYLLAADNDHHPRISHSLNNIKQLAIALQAYAIDNDGRFPGWVTTPDGSLSHNAWDEQVWSYVKSRDVFTNGDTGIRSYSDPQRQRVLTYGLNGLLITPGKEFDGTADWSRPAPRKWDSLAHPEDTILFAELATDAPMTGIYGRPPEPPPARTKATPSEQWNAAFDGWIDIDPTAFVETSGPVDSYDKEKWDAARGVARGKYAGGGNYAFVDGHVKFMRLSQTVGQNMSVPPEKYWAADNPHNMWNPDR
jgi:prepilin-type processing-associated H-X9-DG protein